MLVVVQFLKTPKTTVRSSRDGVFKKPKENLPNIALRFD
jgi:hypothetical protein